MSSVSGEAPFVIVSSRPLGGTSSFPFVYKPPSEPPVFLPVWEETITATRRARIILQPGAPCGLVDVGFIGTAEVMTRRLTSEIEICVMMRPQRPR